MFTLFEQPKEFYELSDEMRSVAAELCKPLLPQAELRHYAERELVTEGTGSDGPLVLVEEGFVRVEVEGKLLYLSEPGELLGLLHGLRLDVRILADSPVRARLIGRSAVDAAIDGSREQAARFRRLHLLFSEAILRLLARTNSGDAELSPDRRYFRPGDPIIIQDTAPSEVFTMLYGRADVYVNATRVGTVLSGEIFGAMSATTDSRRSASVIASTECIVSVVPKELFLGLIKTHPTTVHRLIENMSRVIVSQNEKIVGMTN
jgi:CRP-like cAMP-binding protein